MREDMTQAQRLVRGHGINDVGRIPYVNGKQSSAYQAWNAMLQRCYDHKYQARQPTYIGCSVCPEWLYFSNFQRWFDENYREGFALDKDILVAGNKIYSPKTCRYVPQYLNLLLTDRGAARGELPLGIDRNNMSYRARCNDGHGKNLTKTFKHLEDAVAWYKQTKKRVVKEQAIRAFLDNDIKTDVYLALVRREF